MTLTIKAGYEGGIFKPEGAIDIPEHEEVALTISPLATLEPPQARRERIPLLEQCG